MGAIDVFLSVFILSSLAVQSHGFLKKNGFGTRSLNRVPHLNAIQTTENSDISPEKIGVLFLNLGGPEKLEVYCLKC